MSPLCFRALYAGPRSIIGGIVGSSGRSRTPGDRLLEESSSSTPNSPSFRVVGNVQHRRGMAQQQQQQEHVAPKDEVVRFVTECLQKAGACEENAATVAHHLMTADYRGHFSHGLNRMEIYVKNLQELVTDPLAKPVVVKDFQAIALVDGLNGLGHVVGKFCMQLAIDKARKFGVGIVSARGSNHYGICGYYTLMAAETGMIGLSCTNTSPLVVPTRSRDTAMGTNPISLAMGTGRGDEFVLDMATSAVALGKIELAQRKQIDIPEGWALDSQGQVTKKPDDALEVMRLLPLGGLEATSGYKGYGLAMMIEVLCGVLAGSAYGPNIRSWTTGKSAANLGHFFMAVDPGAVDSGAGDRLEDLLELMRRLQPAEAEKPVMVAGDPERRSMEKVDKEGGIKYHMNQIKSSEKMARELGVDPMKLVRINC